MADFRYEINEKIAQLSSKDEYTCEVNVITYGASRPKLDIRRWDREQDKMLKGITLNKEEALALYEALKDFDFDLLDQ